jgi:hypothetical protein
MRRRFAGGRIGHSTVPLRDGGVDTAFAHQDDGLKGEVGHLPMREVARLAGSPEMDLASTMCKASRSLHTRASARAPQCSVREPMMVVIVRNADQFHPDARETKKSGQCAERFDERQR